MDPIKEMNHEHNALSDPDVNIEIEDSTEEEKDITISYEYDISSYGADFPVESLVQRLRRGDILVPRFGEYVSDDHDISGFQRNYVWSKPKADRFIESLLLGLPVPSIFLVQDEGKRLLVLDGQQRLLTLLNYYGSGEAQNKIRLGPNVHLGYRGKSYHDLHDSDRRTLDDSLIHAIVVKQLKPKGDQSSVYDIFERLNTGGMNLQPQEIRSALYHGKLADLLSKLNNDTNWRSLYGSKSNRLKDLEMILRFFAFYYDGSSYNKPMKDFLNKYMSKNRNLECQSEEELKNLFEKTTRFVNQNLGRKAFRPFGVLNASVLDSVMTSIAKRIEEHHVSDPSLVKNKLNDLLSDHDFLEAVKAGTSDESKVQTRMQLASKMFETI